MGAILWLLLVCLQLTGAVFAVARGCWGRLKGAAANASVCVCGLFAPAVSSPLQRQEIEITRPPFAEIQIGRPLFALAASFNAMRPGLGEEVLAVGCGSSNGVWPPRAPDRDRRQMSES